MGLMGSMGIRLWIGMIFNYLIRYEYGNIEEREQGRIRENAPN